MTRMKKKNKRAKRLIKNYKKLGFKKFMKKWSEGIEGITPLQNARTSLMGTYLILVGIIFGIVVTSIGKVWWMVIILCGSLIVTTMSWVSTYQKFKKFKEIDRIMKEMQK